MPEDQRPEQGSTDSPAGDERMSGSGTVPPRKKSLTPEQRRFMGTQRAKEKQPEPLEETQPEAELEEPAPNDLSERAVEQTRIAQTEAGTPPPERAPDEEGSTRQRTPDERRTRVAVTEETKSSRLREMQTPLMILLVLASIAGTFYVGKKFEYWKYLLTAGKTPQSAAAAADEKYPGIAADELVAQALTAERAGNVQEAADRLIAAKQKNVSYRGIFFRVGKIAYDNGNFDDADKLMERAIAFGENTDLANYLRGLIAVRKKDLTAAQRFFEAAATADPFSPDYRYYLAEAMRMDHHPTEAIPHYERAALLARNDQEATVCGFKIRMARLEASEMSKVAEEIAERQKAGALPVDWLMTAAALNIRQGNIGEAVRYLNAARDAKNPGLFGSCVSDLFFVGASEIHPEVAEACRLDFDPGFR